MLGGPGLGRNKCFLQLSVKTRAVLFFCIRLYSLLHYQKYIKIYSVILPYLLSRCLVHAFAVFARRSSTWMDTYIFVAFP